MKFSSQEIINLFDKVPACPPQLAGFAIAEVTPGAKIRFSFEDQEMFLVVSKNTLKLFSRRDYYGAVLAARLRYDHDVAIVHPMLMCASAVVLSNRNDQPFVTPINQGADVIWDFEFSKPVYLRRHFAKVFPDYKQNYPESFEADYGELLMMEIKLHLQDDGISL